MERHSLICGPDDLLATERWANEGGMIAPEAVLCRERRMAAAARQREASRPVIDVPLPAADDPPPRSA